MTKRRFTWVAYAAAVRGSLRYDTIRDAILTCNQKLTRVSLICCTEPHSWRHLGLQLDELLITTCTVFARGTVWNNLKCNVFGFSSFINASKYLYYHVTWVNVRTFSLALFHRFQNCFVTFNSILCSSYDVCSCFVGLIAVLYTCALCWRPFNAVYFNKSNALTQFKAPSRK